MPPCRHCPYPTPYPFHLPVGAGHTRPATSRLPPLNPPFVGRGLDPSAAPCLCPTAYPLHLPVGAGHARPATSRLPLLNPLFVGRGLDPSAAPCLCPTPYPFHLPVGAGHARPATSRLPPFNPLFVGRGLDPSAAPCPYRCFIFHAGGIPAALPLLQLCLLCAGAGFICPGHVSFDADSSFCSVGRGLDPSAELPKNACRGEHCSPVPVCLARKPSRKMRCGGKWAGDQWSPLHTQ